jgi:hypothetical protein
LGAPINYETVFFRRPLLTDDNIRFGSILFALFIFTLILHFFIFNWLKNIPVTQLQENIRKEYVAFIAESVNIIKSVDQAVELPSSGTYSQEIPTRAGIQETNQQQNQAVTSSENDITDLISETDAMGIATIATAVENTPGFSGYIYMTDRREKALTLRNDVTVYRSHQKRIQIPLPEKIQFASQNGNRDLFETTATMEMNEIDIKYCFEKVARYDPTMSGDLLVSFTIHPNGHVIPTSVKVINSNIRDPRIIDCIRKQIQRWRNFKQIAFEDGNFTITRKYVF